MLVKTRGCGRKKRRGRGVFVISTKLLDRFVTDNPLWLPRMQNYLSLIGTRQRKADHTPWHWNHSWTLGAALANFVLVYYAKWRDVARRNRAYIRKNKRANWSRKNGKQFAYICKQKSSDCKYSYVLTRLSLSNDSTCRLRVGTYSYEHVVNIMFVVCTAWRVFNDV